MRVAIIRTLQSARLRAEQLRDWVMALPWERLRYHRRRKRVVMAHYHNNDVLWRKLAIFVLPLGLGLFSLVYGFFFALTAPYLVTQFLAPIAVLAVLCIWALPDQRKVPITAAHYCFVAFLAGLVMWPNYLAIALPGLPWITVQRLTGIPMALALLICVSSSKAFRDEIATTLNNTPLIWKAMAGFVAIQFLTLPMSNSLALSVNRVVIQQINWTAVLVLSAYVFRKEGRIERFFSLLCLLGVPLIVMAVVESRLQHVLWNGYAPSFLKVDEASRMFQASMRSADGIYRTKTTFSTPLGLAEYMAILMPFLIHFAATKRPVLIRIGAALMVPLCFATIQLSGSRLGVVGTLVSLLLYLLLWGLVRWRNRPGDAVGPAIVLTYPVVFLTTVATTMFWRRAHVMVFGGGAQKASNEARGRQIEMAIPKIFQNPVGHGAGQSGDTMGYLPGQFVAVDNYYITIGLDYGVLGLITFYGMILAAIYYSVHAVLTPKAPDKPENMYLIPIAVAFSAFLIIKWVFSQADNHPIYYMMLGVVPVLVHRIRADTKAAGA
jgi:hypothetical protein